MRTGIYEDAIPSDEVKKAVDKALKGEDYSQGALYFRTIKGARKSWHEVNLTALFDYNRHRFYR